MTDAETIEALKEAMQPVCRYLDNFEAFERHKILADDAMIFVGVGELRRARAVLIAISTPAHTDAKIKGEVE